MLLLALFYMLFTIFIIGPKHDAWSEFMGFIVCTIFVIAMASLTWCGINYILKFYGLL